MTLKLAKHWRFWGIDINVSLTPLRKKNIFVYMYNTIGNF